MILLKREKKKKKKKEKKSGEGGARDIPTKAKIPPVASTPAYPKLQKNEKIILKGRRNKRQKKKKRKREENKRRKKKVKEEVKTNLPQATSKPELMNDTTICGKHI